MTCDGTRHVFAALHRDETSPPPDREILLQVVTAAKVKAACFMWLTALLVMDYWETLAEMSAFFRLQSSTGDVSNSPHHFMRKTAG